MSYLKIYGERNTGTNYLDQLIGMNYGIQSLPGNPPEQLWPFNATFRGSDLFREAWHHATFYKNLGWKHTRIAFPKFANAFSRFDHLHIICLFKNPYSWILSLHKRPYHLSGHVGLRLEDFLSLPCRARLREHTRGKVKNVVELWNIKARSYLECQQKWNAKFVFYETILSDWLQVLKDIETHFQWEQPSSYMNIERGTKGENKSFDDYNRYYLNEEWRNSLTKEAITIINNDLDFDLVRKLGYKKIDW